jgi:hypothetical protein
MKHLPKPPAPAARAPEQGLKPRTSGFQNIAERLQTRVTLDKGIDANTPLRDALEFLGDRHDLTILVDTAAFKKAGLDEAASSLVGLDKVVGVRPGTVLDLLLRQMNVPGAYLALSDSVVIVPLQDARPESLPANQTTPPRVNLPLVNAVFAHDPLSNALGELSAQADISIVLDQRLTKNESMSPVTGTFRNVPLDTAVRVLANMSGLSTVLLDNVVYITSRENVKSLEAELAKRRTAE